MATDIFNIEAKKDREGSYRDKINTIDEKGGRKWVYPKKPKGRFTRRREIVAFFLLAIFFSGPFLKINGNPVLLLNFIERKFVIFGMAFWPADFHLAALALLTIVVFVVLFTSVFGRVWCGWACPQTIFMEMVFRKIEYWIEGDRAAQIRLNKQAWNAEKIRKKVLKTGIFFGISFTISNLFLAYIIGAEQLGQIITDPPSEHLAGLASITLFSFVFYSVFARFREQVCHFACPYGRYQSVLINEDSIAVSYDFKRGETRANPRIRAKLKKHTVKQAKPMSDADLKAFLNELGVDVAEDSRIGDCIDCEECVRVCPMGIDIRNGIQLECVQCTACIDACDAVMDKIKQPRGLIRYSSLNNIKFGEKLRFTPRIGAYTTVLALLLIGFTFLISTRENTETIILRQPGLLYQELPGNEYSNVYNVTVVNKTFDEFPLDIQVVKPEGATIRPIGTLDKVEPQGLLDGKFLVIIPENKLKPRRNEVEFAVFANGELIEHVASSFIGPDRISKPETSNE